MKTPLLPSILSLAAVFTGNCLALTPIEEDFEAAKLDKSRWYQYKPANGRLINDEGKLNFVTKGAPTKDDFVSIELLTSQPGFSENWQMVLDLTNTTNLRKAGGCGFMIFNGQDRDDYLYVNFFGTAGLDTGLFDNLDFIPAGKLSTKSGVAKGAIRVRFSKASKLLTFDVSLTQKSDGYEWVEVGTFAPNGGKKGNVKAAWKMNAESTFGLQLFGFAEGNKVAAGKIMIDNFSVSAGQ